MRLAAKVGMCVAVLASGAEAQTGSRKITATNVALATAAVTTVLLDRGHTEWFLRHTDLEESNPLIGPRPSIGQLNTYMGVCIAGMLGVGYALKGGYRNLWFGGIAALESAILLHDGLILRLPIRF